MDVLGIHPGDDGKTATPSATSCSSVPRRRDHVGRDGSPGRRKCPRKVGSVAGQVSGHLVGARACERAVRSPGACGFQASPVENLRRIKAITGSSRRAG